MKVALNQITVGQVQGGGLDDAVNHFSGVVKEPLVMRAKRSAIGDDQCLLTRSPRPAAALGVVGRSGRDVAQVHRVERRDVNTQLHRGRAKHHRQALQRRFVSGVVQPILAVFFGITEALLQQLAAVGIDLRGVLLCLEVEQGVALLTQGLCHGLVKVTKELVVLTVLKRLRFIDQQPVHGRRVEPPAHHLVVHIKLLNVAVIGCCLEQLFHELDPLRVFPTHHLTGCGTVFPERGGLEVLEEARAGTTWNQVNTRFALVIWPLGENQVLAGFEVLVPGKSPALIQILVRCRLGFVLLHRIQITRF